MMVLRLLRPAGSRLLQLALVVTLVSALVLGLVRLVPGDPASSILGIHATPESLAALRAQLGIGNAYFPELIQSLGNLLQGDLGQSLVSSQPVTEMVLPTLAVTLSLIGMTTVFALVIGIPLGLLAGLRRTPLTRTVVGLANSTMLAVPPVLAGVVLLLLVALGLGLAPAGGWAGSWPANFEYAWLPSLTLSLYLIPYVSRSVSHAAAEASVQPYVDAAVTRGIPPVKVIVRHVLPNSLVPLITLVGYNASFLIGGAVVVEAIFGIPGLGGVLTSAVTSRDFPVLQGVAIVTAVVVVLINMASDILYELVDPRIRRQSA